MSNSVVKSIAQLGFPFKTPDPFLFAVYHNDAYPTGNASNMHAPRRGDGADFDWSAPYRMYHGDRIPGFPQHPHRGFETMTLVREGTCDHTDSQGAAGRYGGDGSSSDLQWMTAGRGCVHGENFPLVSSVKPNTLKLFQIWLNLPARSKMCEPGFEMYWAEQALHIQGERGASCEVAAGRLGSEHAGVSKAPPQSSWAADPVNDVGLFLIDLPSGGGKFELPRAAGGAAINRMAYLVEGARGGDCGVTIGGMAIPLAFKGRAAVELRGDGACVMENTHASEAAQVLVLQGRPIGEPVAQHGPFVMNTQQEIEQAFSDYRQTLFGAHTDIHTCIYLLSFLTFVLQQAAGHGTRTP